MSSEETPALATDAIRIAESSDLSRQLTDHVAVPVCESDSSGRIVYVNPPMEALLGYSAEALKQMGPRDLIHEDDLADVEAHQRAALLPGAAPAQPFRALHRDGSLRFIEATTTSYATTSGEQRVVTVLHNVTDQLAQKASLENRLRLETLLADLSRRFVLTDEPDLDDAIRDGLQQVAAVGGAERAFLLCLPRNELEESSFFEWSAVSAPMRTDLPRGREGGQYPGLAGRLVRGESICARVVAELPDEFASERDALIADGVRSYLLLPSIRGQRLVGILGLHCLEKENAWLDPELGVLRLMTDLLTGTVRQRRYETALAESEGRFRALADNSRDSICEISAAGEILYVGPAYAELLDKTQDELVGSNVYLQIHPDDRDSIRTGVGEVLEGDDRGVVVYRTAHRDGSWLYIEASARGFSSHSGEPRLVAVLRDVTARERNRVVLERHVAAEKRVAELARFFLDTEATSIGRAIEENLATAGEIAEADHSFVFATLHDDGGHRLYRSAKDRVDPSRIALPAPLLVNYAWLQSEMADGAERVVLRASELPLEAHAVREDMERRGMSSFLAVPLVSERRLIGFMGFEALFAERVWSRETITLLRLIAEIFVSALRREHADLEIERGRRQLLQSQKMEAVGTLAGGIAHDFNNHLAVMLGNARFLLDEVGGASDIRDSLVDLQRSAEHCAQLTRSLLEFSRLSPSKIDVVAVGDALKTVAELVRPLLPSSIEFEVGDGAPDDAVRADPTQLRQVLVNLLVNARDAMPSGGRLSLRARRVRVSEAESTAFGLPGEGTYVELSVRDNGCGMPPEIVERIFEPFFTTKPLGQGTGLGLATAYGIVRQNGGAIAVESDPGEGSRFRVLLPLAIGACEQEAPQPAHTALPGTELVLLVEDEPAVRRLVARILRRAGYTVIEAVDGVAGFEAAEQHWSELRLVVTDLVMPRMGGAELAEKLRASRPDLRVLFLSGHADPSAGTAWNDTNSAPFLQKPFSDEALLSSVRRLLEAD